MIKGFDSLTIGSANAKALADFYKEKVGFEIAMEFKMGDNNQKGFQLKIAEGSDLMILDHSEVKGKNTQPQRYIINLEVDDIESDFKKLSDGGVKVIQEIYHIEDYGYVATFEDLEGNYFQLVKTRE